MEAGLRNKPNPVTPLSSVLHNHYKPAFCLRRRSRLVAGSRFPRSVSRRLRLARAQSRGYQLAADAFITLLTPSSSFCFLRERERSTRAKKGSWLSTRSDPRCSRLLIEHVVLAERLRQFNKQRRFSTRSGWPMFHRRPTIAQSPLRRGNTQRGLDVWSDQSTTSGAYYSTR